MPLYEALFYIAPRAGAEATKKVLRDRAELIFKNNGFIRRLDNMGIIPLAYPMYRHQNKYYEARSVYMLIDAGKECLTEFEKDLRNCDLVFRHAIYKQKNKFRDAFDEMYIHHGIESGKTLEVKEELLREMENDIVSRLEESDQLKPPTKLEVDEDLQWNFMHKFKQRLQSIKSQREEKEKLEADREAERVRVSEQQRAALKKKK